MTLRGKGMFAWRVKNIRGGDPQKAADVASAAGLTHVVLKIVDGIWPYNLTATLVDLLPPLIAALKAKQIECWAWAYTYGQGRQLLEAQNAVSRFAHLGLSGFVIDAEAEYKVAGGSVWAAQYADTLRAQLPPKTPVFLCSYRYPSVHPEFPWQAFLSRVDGVMPQVYWEQAHNPTSQLERSVTEFKALAPGKPIIPVGPSYRTGLWWPSPDEAQAFLDKTLALGLPAADFFSWDECDGILWATYWAKIAGFAWPLAPLPPADLTLEQKVDILWAEYKKVHP
jgi:hypothetical protein